MPPVSYLNFYIALLVAFLAATIGGVFYFYSGMEGVSFWVSSGMSRSMYYTDKSQYDLLLYGLIYSMTFLIAGALFFAVIAVPSADQVQQKLQMANPYSAASVNNLRTAAPTMMQAPQAPAAPMQAPQATMQAPQAPQTPVQAPIAGTEAPAATPPIGERAEAPAASNNSDVEQVPEDFEIADDEVDDFENGDRANDVGDADVVYGAGRIRDTNIVDYINRHPDSAVKFLYRRNLDGKPVSQAEDEIYRVWQKRGMSRGKVRDYICQIMEWDQIPNQSLHDTWSQLRDQIFEMTH